MKTEGFRAVVKALARTLEPDEVRRLFREAVEGKPGPPGTLKIGGTTYEIKSPSLAIAAVFRQDHIYPRNPRVLARLERILESTLVRGTH